MNEDTEAGKLGHFGGMVGSGGNCEALLVLGLV
jgi:hypothetical protein